MCKCSLSTGSCLFDGHLPRFLSVAAPWAAGSEYVYRLQALSVSDIPELSSQAAGIKFDAQMIIYCRDAGSIVVKVIRLTCFWFPPVYLL